MNCRSQSGYGDTNMIPVQRTHLQGSSWPRITIQTPWLLQKILKRQ